MHRALGKLFQTSPCSGRDVPAGPAELQGGLAVGWAVWEKGIWDSLLASARCVFLAFPRVGTQDGENKQTGLFRGV